MIQIAGAQMLTCVCLKVNYSILVPFIWSPNLIPGPIQGITFDL